MKKKFKLFTALFLFVLAVNMSMAQGISPTYNLTAKNFSLGSINYPDDVLYFDIYIEWTNSGVATNFEFSGSQLYFSFNRLVLTGTWPPAGPSANPDTSEFSYKIISTDFPQFPAMVPRNNSVYIATSPTADIMRGAVNEFPGAGNGANIPAGFPGTKICTYRLWNKGGPFNPEPLNLAWRNPPIVAFATKIFAHVGTEGRDITTPATHTIDSIPGFTKDIGLKLSIIPEGLYYPLFNLMSRRDTVRTYIRNISSPYSTVDSAKGVIDSLSFTNKFIFNNASSGTYYIVVKHFNSIETWSKNGGEAFILGDSTIYNFTTANTQAYGNNQKLKGSKYCIYSGDVNQDLWIDGTDLAQLDNDAYSFLSGRFLPSDLNGDNIVDGADFSIGDNNWRYVHTISPINPSLSGIDGYVQP